MPVIGITGGIATGKSTFTQALLRCQPAELFDSDRTAKQLLAENEAVRLAVAKAFGPEIFDSQGQPDRVRLRELIFADEANRKKLESILHPAIRTQWLALAEQHRESRRWLYVDIPLLYETGVESQFDRVIVVASSPATQRRRLEANRGMPPALAESIIAAQLDLQTKIKRADHLIWNDSSLSCLHGQTSLLAGWLRQRYG